MQVIGNESSGPGNFHEGFNRGLQQLVQMKLSKLQQRHDMGNIQKAFQAFGIPAEKAQAFASLPPEMQKQFIDSGLLSSLQGPSAEQQPMEQSSSMQQALQQSVPEEKDSTGQLMRSMGMMPTSPIDQAAQNAVWGKQGAQNLTQQVAPQQQQVQQQEQVQQQAQPRVAQQKPGALLTSKERAAQIKEQREMDKETRKEQHLINKEVGPAHKELLKDYKGAIEDDRRLGRLKELVEQDKLSHPRWHSLLNTVEHGVFGLGINLHSLESPQSQEFDKISKEFLKNAKNIFGARITDNDVRVFLKMVPDLSQSKEGKLAVIHNMQLYNEGVKARFKASQQLIKENGGRLPFDYEDRIEELAGPQLDAIAQRFVTEERIPKKEESSSGIGLPSPEIPNPLDIIFGR